MSSEEFQRKAELINGVSSLITKLSNFQSALRDFDKLRLDGARFLSPEDEEYQEFMADMDGIRMMACGPAGDAVRAELRDPGLIDTLCGSNEPDENEWRMLGAAVDRALAKSQEKLQKVLVGD